jgi:hypothetical protein
MVSTRRLARHCDPRQGFETCGFVEFMLTDEIMMRLTGNPVWADRCEEIAFNSLPAALTPDHRALHYITCANSVQLDKVGKTLGQFGNGEYPMLAYEPSPHNYRCCPHNSVSVDYGPLTFSLDIKERWTTYDPEKNPAWLGSEVFPDSAWNYGLVADQKFEVVRQPGPLAANPFARDGVPLALRAKARKLPAWRTDDDGVVGPLQPSPARTTEPLEDITLIPMAAARLRIASFPTVTDDTGGQIWSAPPHAVVKVSSSHAEWPWVPQALFHGIEPANSHDESVPRFAWWNHTGTREWIRYKFPKPARVSAVAVYWFDDQRAKSWYAGSGAFAVPRSWTAEYNDGNTWKPVAASGAYGTAIDRDNRVEFMPVVTAALRLTIQLQPGKSAGLYMWKVCDGDMQLAPTASVAAEQALNAGTALPPPTAMPAAESWFKPQMLKDIANGQAIRLWCDDASGGNDASLAPSAAAPIVIQNAINGLPMAHFDADKKQMLALPRTIEDDFTIAVVFRSTQGIGTGHAFFQGAALVQGEIGGETDDFGISLNARGQVLAGTGKPDTSLASPPGFNDACVIKGWFFGMSENTHELTRPSQRNELADGLPLCADRQSPVSLIGNYGLNSILSLAVAKGLPAHGRQIHQSVVHGEATRLYAIVLGPGLGSVTSNPCSINSRPPCRIVIFVSRFCTS